MSQVENEISEISEIIRDLRRRIERLKEAPHAFLSPEEIAALSGRESKHARSKPCARWLWHSSQAVSEKRFWRGRHSDRQMQSNCCDNMLYYKYINSLYIVSDHPAHNDLGVIMQIRENFICSNVVSEGIYLDRDSGVVVAWAFMTMYSVPFHVVLRVLSEPVRRRTTDPQPLSIVELVRRAKIMESGGRNRTTRKPTDYT